jgi:hypothetical protein
VVAAVDGAAEADQLGTAEEIGGHYSGGLGEGLKNL